jgi:CheY-like chemotaxis protein
VRDADGQHIGLATITRDITEQKRAEDELRRIAADLSEADHRKSEFLATLAHELRNPLAPIRTGLDLLRMAPRECGHRGRRRRRVHGMMDRQLGHLIHLVDDLLDIARITRGKIELKKERSAAHYRRDGRRDQHRADRGRRPPAAGGPAATSRWLEADLTRMVQVLSNLLNNAAKYTPAGGRIALSAWREERPGGGRGDRQRHRHRAGSHRFGVRDVHPGAQQPRPGPGRPRDRPVAGAAPGRAARRPGAAPSAPAAAAAAPSPCACRCGGHPGAAKEAGGAPAREAGGRLRVLVVDDNVDAADSLVALLDALGHETRVAHDGPQGLASGARLPARPGLPRHRPAGHERPRTGARDTARHRRRCAAWCWSR